MFQLPEWVPEYYTGDDLPHEMPQSLKAAIKADSNRKVINAMCFKDSFILFTCKYVVEVMGTL